MGGWVGQWVAGQMVNTELSMVNNDINDKQAICWVDGWVGGSTMILPTKMTKSDGWVSEWVDGGSKSRFKDCLH